MAVKLTNERLQEIHDFWVEPQVGSTTVKGSEICSIVKELLLLRAECRAAREMRYFMNNSRSEHTKLYDSARKATDDAGFSV